MPIELIKMKLLYIGDKDIFSRHELGFIAALTDVGSVEVVNVSSSKREAMRISSDNGTRVINVSPIATLEAP